MSLLSVKAQLSCDRCGKNFEIILDPAEERSGASSFSDLVDEAVRNGTEVDLAPGNRSNQSGPYFTSMFNHDHICGECTLKSDDEEDEEDAEFDGDWTHPGPRPGWNRAAT